MNSSISHLENFVVFVFSAFVGVLDSNSFSAMTFFRRNEANLFLGPPHTKTAAFAVVLDR
jgi:hypothetical protein